MFLIVDPKWANMVFLETDPRNVGCDAPVEADVKLEVSDDLYSWRDGQEGPLPCVGVSTTEPHLYRVFRTDSECRETRGFHLLGGNPIMRYGTWEDYRRAFPEHPERLLS
jgi:hypothetical protein